MGTRKNRVPTEEELTSTLETWTYAIKETENWRPIAKYVLGIFMPIIEDLEADLEYWKDRAMN